MMMASTSKNESMQNADEVCAMGAGQNSHPSAKYSNYADFYLYSEIYSEGIVKST